MEDIKHLWMTLLICCSTIPAHVLCLIFAHKFCFGIVSSNDHVSLPFYVYFLFVYYITDKKSTGLDNTKCVL